MNESFVTDLGDAKEETKGQVLDACLVDGEQNGEGKDLYFPIPIGCP